MRADYELGERREEVRLAAKAWRRAGIIDEKALESILARYPDDRVRVRPAFRFLFFVFAGVAVVSAFTLLTLFELPLGFLLFSFACASVALTELQRGKYRRAGTGSDEATALLAVFFATLTCAYFLLDDGSSGGAWRSVSFALATVSAAACFRWGVPILGALSAASAFSMLAWWPGARVSFILLALVVMVPLLRGSVSKDLAPSHRSACDFALVTSLLALYLALHVGSYDSGLLETELLSGFQREPTGSTRFLFVLATALMPALLFASGLRWRRPILLRSGIVLAVASLVTLRFYVHVAPLWVVLTVSGGVAVGLALLVHRFLSRGPEGARYGFTAEPVFERLSPAVVLEVGMAAALAPAPEEERGRPAFRGSGGEFGGGGASGKY